MRSSFLKYNTAKIKGAIGGVLTVLDIWSQIRFPPCSREEQENYIWKIYPPGGMQIKKIWGVFLCGRLWESCGYLSRGRGVKCARFKHGEFFKTQNPLCRLVCIGGLTILFIKMGVWGCLLFTYLTLLGGGYLLFLFCVTDMIIIATSRSNLWLPSIFFLTI